jgi:DNA-binding NarL/FixJ family response regulator
MSAGGSLSVARASGRPLALLVSPLHTGPSFLPRPCAVVFVTDPDREPRAAAAVLRHLYGLTEREAALADALLRGMNVREAAAALGVSMNTARTFLRFVLRKTGTRRQAELVALMARSTFAGRGRLET